ncbi:MAG: energy transducer TonB [Holophagaceae bacterium]|nr:energy transducer TonB [Holophagaceae bacterium]
MPRPPSSTPVTLTVTLAELEAPQAPPAPPVPLRREREAGGTGTVDPRVLRLVQRSARDLSEIPDATPRFLPTDLEPGSVANRSLPVAPGGDGKPRASSDGQGASAAEGRFRGVPGGQALEVGVKDLHVYREVYPDYPTLARTAGIQGDVVVRFHLDEKGAPLDLKIIQGPPALHAAVMKAAREWRFGGMVFRGQPVQTLFDLTFRFRIVRRGES